MNIKIKKLNENAIIPAYQTSGASGFDFRASEAVLIEPGATALISTGIAIELPTGYELQIRPRSGLSAKTKLRVVLGTVDSDFVGEIKIIADNAGFLPIHINQGDRIAQGVLSHCFRASFTLVEELGETERSDKGFGHSGR